MFQYLSWLANPFVAGVLSGIIMCIVVFIDGWINETDTDSKDYLKLFCSSTIVIIIIIYINRYMSSCPIDTIRHSRHVGGDSVGGGGSHGVGGGSDCSFDCGAPDF
jgi:uncharacterized membrane protein YgcG